MVYVIFFRNIKQVYSSRELAEKALANFIINFCLTLPDKYKNIININLMLSFILKSEYANVISNWNNHSYDNKHKAHILECTFDSNNYM